MNKSNRVLLAVSTLFLGCATLPQPHREASDTACGTVEMVNVRLAQGVQAWPSLMSCDEARAAVKEGLLEARVSLPQPVDLIFVAGPAGHRLSRDFLHYEPVYAFTYGETRTILVNVNSLHNLAHEFGHMEDVENGRPNTRDN